MKNETEILAMAQKLPIPDGYRFLGVEFSGGNYNAVFWKGSIGSIEKKEVNITNRVKQLREELNAT